jgi:hypothetical protein
MKLKVFILLLVAVAAIGAVAVLNFPKIRFTVHVVGEDGQPISGANAMFLFNQDSSALNKMTQVPGVTDGNGNLTAEGYSPYGTVAGQPFTKDSYYVSNASIPQFTKDDGLGHWLPWDQTYTTVMRKIGNPIPMYAKNVNIDIPAVGQPCGYDLVIGDWVGPYGKGRTSDLVMTLQRQWQDVYHFDVSVVISFSNPGDGIQITQLPKEFANSDFKWPRLAPENGYQSNFTIHVTSNPKTGFQGMTPEDQTYFFRVRTTEQNGNASNALYGKIASGIKLMPGASKTCEVHLNYYLNPTSNDRNMEYGSTLFKNLEFLETPREP